MTRLAWMMLWGDRAKVAGLIFGVAFTSFLVTFAASYFCGFMTRGFALVAEHPEADVWVMDAATESVEQAINIPQSALPRVASVDGVRCALPLGLATVEARFPNGRFQSFQLIAVDGAALAGLPHFARPPEALRTPDAVVVDDGGTVGKLETAERAEDRWNLGAPHLDTPTRHLDDGDTVLVNDHTIRVIGASDTLPRFPPRPLMFTTFENAGRLLPRERHRLTFVLASADDGVTPKELATRIEARTGLRARSAEDFRADTVVWYLVNSEDVGDIAAMLSLAMSVGFGVTAIMLYMFTRDAMKQYAVLKAMGTTPRTIAGMVFVQSLGSALLGSGIGLGLCTVAGRVAGSAAYPFRMMWFTPIVGCLMVALVSLVAALLSARPAMKLDPSVVFAGR